MYATELTFTGCASFHLYLRGWDIYCTYRLNFIAYLLSINSSYITKFPGRPSPFLFSNQLTIRLFLFYLPLFFKENQLKEYRQEVPSSSSVVICKQKIRSSSRLTRPKVNNWLSFNTSAKTVTTIFTACCFKVFG